MDKITKKYIVPVSIAVLVLLPAVASAFASAPTQCSLFKEQFDGLFQWVDCARYGNIYSLLAFVIQTLLMLAGGVAVLFIIIGGYRYIASNGNEEQVESGRKTLTNAVIGLVIIILASTIVRITVNTITGGAAAPGTTQPATPGGTQPNVQNVKDLRSIVDVGDLPTSVPVNGVVSIVATVKSADIPALLEICKVGDVSAVSFSLYVDPPGKLLGTPVRFSKQTNMEALASAQFSSNSFPDEKATIFVQVCGNPIAATEDIQKRSTTP